MPSQDDIQYALETTRVLHEPDHRIQTFGETRFEFQLLSEPMDQVGKVRIMTFDCRKAFQAYEVQNLPDLGSAARYLEDRYLNGSTPTIKPV